jgi:hypothetical protein|tara:strand:- start:1618 stop:1809 length:192 start_codon:yes stop_codon:yes gene_type:complete
MDIKTITGAIGAIIAIASLFVFQGQLIQRVEVLESKMVDQKEITAIKKDIESLQRKNKNPLSQ